MSPETISQFFLEVIGKIEFYWQFYTATLIAVMGWFLGTKDPPPLRLRVLIALGYVFFAMMNIAALWGSYTLAESLRRDLIIELQKAPSILINTRGNLEAISYHSQKYLSLVIHGVVGISLLCMIFLTRKASRNPE